MKNNAKEMLRKQFGEMGRHVMIDADRVVDKRWLDEVWKPEGLVAIKAIDEKIDELKAERQKVWDSFEQRKDDFKEENSRRDKIQVEVSAIRDKFENGATLDELEMHINHFIEKYGITYDGDEYTVTRGLE